MQFGSVGFTVSLKGDKFDILLDKLMRRRQRFRARIGDQRFDRRVQGLGAGQRVGEGGEGDIRIDGRHLGRRLRGGRPRR